MSNVQGEQITALYTVWTVRAQQKTFILSSRLVSITPTQGNKLILRVYNRFKMKTIDDLFISFPFSLIKVMMKLMVGYKVVQHGRIISYTIILFTI